MIKKVILIYQLFQDLMKKKTQHLVSLFIKQFFFSQDPVKCILDPADEGGDVDTDVSDLDEQEPDAGNDKLKRKKKQVRLYP